MGGTRAGSERPQLAGERTAWEGPVDPPGQAGTDPRVHFLMSLPVQFPLSLDICSFTRGRAAVPVPIWWLRPCRRASRALDGLTRAINPWPARQAARPRLVSGVLPCPRPVAVPPTLTSLGCGADRRPGGWPGSKPPRRPHQKSPAIPRPAVVAHAIPLTRSSGVEVRSVAGRRHHARPHHEVAEPLAVPAVGWRRHAEAGPARQRSRRARCPGGRAC